MEINESRLKLFYIIKILALAPISIKSNCKSVIEIQRSTVFTIYSTILGLTIIIMLVKNAILSVHSRREFITPSNTHKVVIILNTFSNSLSYASAIGCGLFSVKSLKEFNYRIRKCDVALECFTNFKRDRLIIILITIVPISLGLIVANFDAWIWIHKNELMATWADEGPLTRGKAYYTIQVTTLAFLILYITTAYGLGRRFESLNMMLKFYYLPDNQSNAKTSPDQVNSGFLSKESYVKTHTELLKSIANHHKSIYKCVKIFSNSYGFAILGFLINKMLHITASAYFLYVALINGKNRVIVVQMVIWIIADILKLLVLVEPCQMATVKAKETIQILTEINRYINEPMLEEKITEFWQQLRFTKVEFSAMDIFIIDRGLLTSVASSITIFLAILIQFQNMN